MQPNPANTLPWYQLGFSLCWLSCAEEAMYSSSTYCGMDRVEGRDGRVDMGDDAGSSRVMVVEMSLALIACESIHGESIHVHVSASEVLYVCVG